MNVLRPLLALVAVAVTLILAILAWDSVGATTSEISWRIFLVGWVGAVAVIAAGSATAALPLAVQHIAVGLVAGLAIGTTDWTNLSLGEWWQLWWTVPLLLFYASLLVASRRSSRTSS
jgi:hypothetical protein